MNRHYPPPKYRAPDTPAPQAGQLPELLRQAREALDAAEHALDNRDSDAFRERMRRVEEIAVFARYVVLATR